MEAFNLSIDFETDNHGWKNDIFTIGSDWKIIDGALTSQSSGSNRFFVETGGKPDGIHTTTYTLRAAGEYAIIIRDTGSLWRLYPVASSPFRRLSGELLTPRIPTVSKIRACHTQQCGNYGASLDEAKSLVTVAVNGRTSSERGGTRRRYCVVGKVYYGGITAEGAGFQGNQNYL